VLLPCFSPSCVRGRNYRGPVSSALMAWTAWREARITVMATREQRVYLAHENGWTGSYKDKAPALEVLSGTCWDLHRRHAPRSTWRARTAR